MFSSNWQVVQNLPVLRSAVITHSEFVQLMRKAFLESSFNVPKYRLRKTKRKLGMLKHPFVYFSIRKNLEVSVLNNLPRHELQEEQEIKTRGVWWFVWQRCAWTGTALELSLPTIEDTANIKNAKEELRRHEIFTAFRHRRMGRELPSPPIFARPECGKNAC